MFADPFNPSSYDIGVPTQSNHNLGNTPEFWTEWYCGLLDDPTHMVAVASVHSPTGSNLSEGFNPPFDLAMKSTLPRSASIDTGIFSRVATETTATNTVNGDEKDSNSVCNISGDRKRRKSSAGTKTSARDGGRDNVFQPCSEHLTLIKAPAADTSAFI